MLYNDEIENCYIKFIYILYKLSLEKNTSTYILESFTKEEYVNLIYN